MGEPLEEYGLIGKRLGKYEVVRLLGCGGMGAAYQAINTLLERIVCLKVLFPALLSSSDAVNRFIREARAVANLEHPNIVQIYDIGEDQGTYYIVMEYIDGKTLAQILEEREVFSVRETLDVGICLAKALNAAHCKNIIHRDIKPANVMIEKKQVKLTDFGLARFADASSSTKDVWGTPHYVAPEYILGKRLDPRADMYSFGITLFQLLAGEPPYSGSSPVEILEQHITGPVPSIRAKRSDVPIGLDAVVKNLTATKRELRYSNMQEVIEVLLQCKEQLARKQNKKTERFTPNLAEIWNKVEEDLPEDKVEGKGIRILVVDDSSTMRKAISRLLNAHERFYVVGSAANGREALKAIPRLKPDVITLDFNMPELDGVGTVKKIMALYPRPVIMLSAFTYDGAVATFESLSCGAIDFVWKTTRSRHEEFKSELIEKIENAAGTELVIPKKSRAPRPLGPSGKNEDGGPAQRIVVMGAGQGGYHACLKIIPYLPKNIPCAIVLVQEMPDNLGDAYCNYLDRRSGIKVRECKDGNVLEQGVCYVTNHLSPIEIERNPDLGAYRIIAGPKFADSQNSAFFIALSSAANQCGSSAVAIALTGRTPDAADGLEKIKDCGGTVLVQKPATCLNSAVCDSAIERKIADQVVADIDIPTLLFNYLKIMPQAPIGRTSRMTRRRFGSTKRLDALAIEKNTVIVVSEHLSSDLQKGLKNYHVIILHDLPELMDYLKLGKGRVILDSDYLGPTVVDFMDILKADAPYSSLFVLADTELEEGTPKEVLSLPYRKNETRLAQLLSPYLYLAKFRYNAGDMSLEVPLFLAQRAKWTLALIINKDEEKEGKIVLYQGRVTEATCGDLQGKAAVEFLLERGVSWKTQDREKRLAQMASKRKPLPLKWENTPSAETIKPEIVLKKAKSESFEADPGPEPERKKILVVEGNERFQRILAIMLKRRDYQLTCTRNGIDAVFYLGKEKFDLIISEIDLPDLDGFKLLKTVQEQKLETPLIFLTSRCAREYEVKGFQLGATDFIKKPIQRDVLLMRVGNVLKTLR